MESIVTFEQFLDEWLADVREGNPSTTELGHRFAHKLLMQWLNIDDSSDDLFYCDGSGDGGIDIAYLYRGGTQETESATEGHTWYLVQSKYGQAFQGTNTLLAEGMKVIDTLDGQRKHLSSLAEGVLELLTAFRRKASDLDKIVLVFATDKPLSNDEMRALDGVRAMGRDRLGPIFDVESVSVATIYHGTDATQSADQHIRLPLKSVLVPSGENLRVGTVSLLDLYGFLNAYRTQTGDLDQLYEKNVRRFLGTRGRINKAILKTLREQPERFGLYNNGITIVVTDFHQDGNGTLVLTDPYVVNGCQTTRTIWEVCYQRLEGGGTGTDPVLEEWRHRAGIGVVVTKIVRVGRSGDELLQAITRYTNSQNAVREKDFIALNDNFKNWAAGMADKYGVFLETQRGGWDSQRAFQRRNPSARQFTEAANAFDLLKVYGAGWLGEAGTAFGRNAAFLPNGTVFRRIMDEDANQDGSSFGVDDLYAVYRLHQATNAYGFGRGAEKASRRQTRFLFYMVTLELLKDVMVKAGIATEPRNFTNSLLRLFEPGKEEAAKALLDTAVDVIDDYLTNGADDSVFLEPSFAKFNNDLNTYLKWEHLGKSEESSPHLRSLIAGYRKTMGWPTGGQQSRRTIITAAITG